MTEILNVTTIMPNYYILDYTFQHTVTANFNMVTVSSTHLGNKFQLGTLNSAHPDD
jgi:hypothetical protein